MDELWIVGKCDGTDTGWEFQGVFSTKEKAIAACRSDQYFIGPAKIDEELPDELTEWIGCFYPLADIPPILDAQASRPAE